jgi:hypothetical protein
MPGVKIAPVVDSLEAVPEFLRGNYEEREGRFYLNGEIEIETPETIANLRSSLENERKTARERGDKLKDYEGLDPVAARKALEDRQRDEHDKAMSKGDFEKIKSDIIADANKKIDLANAKAAKREEQIKQQLKQSAAMSAIAAARGKVKALLPHVLGALDAFEDEETGNWDVQVIEKGQVKRNSRGDPMTPEEFVQSLREVDDFKPLFDGSGMSGSDARGSDQRRKGGKVTVTRAEASDVTTYRRLAKEAAEQGKSFQDYVNIVG